VRWLAENPGYGSPLAPARRDDGPADEPAALDVPAPGPVGAVPGRPPAAAGSAT
jgi:hypothetical protein